LTRGRVAKDESDLDTIKRREALEYVGDHLTRVPVVLAAREARTWAVYRPFQQMRIDELPGVDLAVIRLAYVAYWSLVPFAVFGAIVLHRRRIRLYVLLAPILFVAVTVLVSYGQPRFRVPAEISIVVLAAIGIDALRRRRGERLPRTDVDEAVASLGPVRNQRESQAT
jgi:hypothetical protein